MTPAKARTKLAQCLQLARDNQDEPAVIGFLDFVTKELFQELSAVGFISLREELEETWRSR